MPSDADGGMLPLARPLSASGVKPMEKPSDGLKFIRLADVPSYHYAVLLERE